MSLWAHAVCISQDDRAEKEAQVQLMRRIFTRADLVMADLGEKGGEYDDIVTIFNSSMDIVRIPADHEQIEQERYEMFGLPAYTDRNWESRRIFLARPWFRRVRVMQEYALASTVNMMHGTLILEGQKLPGLISQMIARNSTLRISIVPSCPQDKMLKLIGHEAGSTIFAIYLHSAKPRISVTKFVLYLALQRMRNAQRYTSTMF